MNIHYGSLLIALLWIVSACHQGRAPSLPTEAKGAPSPAAPRISPDGVGNGGTTSRKLVSFTFFSLEKYVRLCLASPRCGLSPAERTLFEKVASSLQTLPASQRPLQFLSEHDHPGTFRQYGVTHPAVDAATGDHPGDPILVNTDRLVTVGPTGLEERIDIPAAAALLFDELAHQVDARFKVLAEHAALDAAAGKLRLFLTSLVTQIDWKPDWSDITATVVADSNEDPFAALLVADPERLVDLSGELREVAQCPSADEKLAGLSLRNLHWHEGEWEGAPHYVPFRSRLHAWLRLTCRRESPFLPDGGQLSHYRRHLLVTLHMDALYEAGKESVVGWRLATEAYRKPKLEQMDCGEREKSPECH